MTRHFYGASHEEFPPEALLRHVVAAERAGFDGIGASDHVQPENNSAANVERAIDVLAGQVLPALRGARV
jgi:alkanesulfonate monooxygenase SsuD/methylene tetrahydromethanopterin reductase-like flavin-dependent oxidoreductase (luciferase family)